VRQQIISYFKRNPQILNIAWNSARVILNIYGRFKTQGNKVVFASFGGRKFDDSPKALYDEISQRHEFDKWDLVWA
jgi:CDP-glycerol glycerophosphotransferase